MIRNLQRREFLDGEKEKNKSLEDYRKKKIALYEKMVQQQSEMLDLQKRSTAALEIIAYKSINSLQPSSHLNSWGPVFMDFGFFTYSWYCNFINVLVFSFSKKIL